MITICLHRPAHATTPTPPRPPGTWTLTPVHFLSFPQTDIKEPSDSSHFTCWNRPGSVYSPQPSQPPREMSWSDRVSAEPPLCQVPEPWGTPETSPMLSRDSEGLTPNQVLELELEARGPEMMEL